MANVPHFDLPFRWASNGHAAEAEQDSLEDVTNCVQAILSTTIGQRMEAPGLGVVDPTFQKQPINLAEIADALAEQEARATALLEQAPDKFDALIARVQAKVSLRE